ncbi:transformer-2 protein homolog beta isoform X2 [Acyrthosiphon pisum]|uniref:RRM domain-containing protein n=1 Tax=Acyrthosiphon pisum TaxID=7029 RepID=A0A8R2A3Z1_ACYPI|nr:transformer-2 protein homolog beta isoform X2 [Acyrthosiphon pisum]|eukprot:XP_001944825.2 PREDICTED: transformer-2 protein homolog beta-like isoform X2 [Acyrthosiphon pisum]
MSDVEDRNGNSKSRSISPSRSRSRSPSDHKSRSRSPTHSKTRSRSLSRPPSRNGSKYKSRSRHSYSRSRSRSRSYSGDRRRSYRSHSRGSGSRRSRHENPKPNKCLGIFGLSVYTTEHQLYDIFAKYGSIDKILIIIDAKSGRSRGFGFAYFKKHEDAKVAKEECSGMEIDGRRIRVDFSITQRPHTPTPGIYMGRPTMREERSSRRRGYDRYDNNRYDRGDRYDRGERYDRYDRDRDYDDYYEGGYRGGGGGGGGRGGGGGGGGHYRERRSPSYYKNRSRYDRSRSRSYSPRAERV